VTQTGADLACTVTDDGSEEPDVTLFYGTSDGGSDPSAWQHSQSLGVLAEGSHTATVSGLSAATTYYYTFRATNSAGEAWGNSGSFATEADDSPKLVRTTVSNVGSTAWTSVDLGRTYVSPVVIATPIYPDGAMVPVVTRIRNASGSGFEVRIERTDGHAEAVSCDVSIVAVEAGVYTQADNGVTMEAVRFTSDVTAENNNWTGEVRSYQNTYANPVVLGQVMSANDPDWSVFWCQGANRTSPPNASNLVVGKTVCEDPDTTRADEIIGYIVVESGTGTIDGVAYSTGLGADTVLGYGDDNTGYSYSISGLSTASAAALSQAGMDGGNGGWAVLVGSNAMTSTSLRLEIDEDQLHDSERNHTTEQVGYIVFE
jgi:hypothetical protein